MPLMKPFRGGRGDSVIPKAQREPHGQTNQGQPKTASPAQAPHWLPPKSWLVWAVPWFVLQHTGTAFLPAPSALLQMVFSPILSSLAEISEAKGWCLSPEVKAGGAELGTRGTETGED